MIKEHTLDRTYLLNWISDLCLCDNMSDIADDIEILLHHMGVHLEWTDLDDLRKQLEYIALDSKCN